MRTSMPAMAAAQMARRRRRDLARLRERFGFAPVDGVADWISDKNGVALAFLRLAASEETLGIGKKAGERLSGRSRAGNGAISAISLRNFPTVSSVDGGVHCSRETAVCHVWSGSGAGDSFGTMGKRGGVGCSSMSSAPSGVAGD